MTDTWKGDVVGLVEAYRSGKRSPAEELEATLAAIESSELNAFSFVDAEGARKRAAEADVSLPLGGVPVGVKELHKVEGWPDTGASLVFKDRVADQTSTMIQRLQAAGANLVGLTTASEFGGLNVSVTPLNGITRNPWDSEATVGGSSGGSSAAVAGGLVPIATGGDGGGSIRIPAGFTGLLGMKGTNGRIPRGPRTRIAPMTVVAGCVARSVRDAARWYDVCAGFDTRDPYSLPSDGLWESSLGTADLAGKRAVITPTLGCAIVAPKVVELIEQAGRQLAVDAGLELVEMDVELPKMTVEWAIANQVDSYITLKDHWPECRDDMTKVMALGMELGLAKMDLPRAAGVEMARIEANETMAAVFDDVDVVISATNPDVAFPAWVEANNRVAGERVPGANNGALTIPANISGNPAVSVPVGFVDGLPVGMQIMARQHDDRLLFDIARVVEQNCPWPLVAG